MHATLSQDLSQIIHAVASETLHASSELDTGEVVSRYRDAHPLSTVQPAILYEAVIRTIIEAGFRVRRPISAPSPKPSQPKQNIR